MEEEGGEEGGEEKKREREEGEEEDEATKQVVSFQHLGLVGSRKESQEYDKKLSQVAAGLGLPQDDKIFILDSITSRKDIRVEYKNPAALILGYIMLIKLVRDKRSAPARSRLQNTKNFMDLDKPIRDLAKEYFDIIANKYFPRGPQNYSEILSGVDPRDIIRYFELLRKLPLQF
jgi:hypothetical protein